MTTPSTPSTCPVHPVVLEILVRNKDHVFTLLNASLSFFTHLHKVVSSGSMSSVPVRFIADEMDPLAKYNTGDELIEALIVRMQGDWDVQYAIEVAWEASYIDVLRPSNILGYSINAKTNGNLFSWISMLRVIRPKEVYPEVSYGHDLTSPVRIELMKMSSDDIKDLVFASSEIVRGWINGIDAPSAVPTPSEDPVVTHRNIDIDAVYNYHDALSQTTSAFREKYLHREAIISMVEALRLVLESKFKDVVTKFDDIQNPMRISVEIGEEPFAKVSFGADINSALVWFFNSDYSDIDFSNGISSAKHEFSRLAMDALRSTGMAQFFATSLK